MHYVEESTHKDGGMCVGGVCVGGVCLRGWCVCACAHTPSVVFKQKREGAADGPFFAQVGAVTGENV